MARPTISPIPTKHGLHYRVRMEVAPDPGTGKRRWETRTAWGRGTELMRGYPKPDSILVNAPSPTLVELMRVIDRLDQDQLEQMLAYARKLEAKG